MDLSFYTINIAVGLALLFLMFRFTLVGLIGAFYSAMIGIEFQESGVDFQFCYFDPTNITADCTTMLINTYDFLNNQWAGLPFAMMFLVFISYVLVKLAWGKGDED